MSLVSLLGALLPGGCSGEEALQVVRLLRQAIDAIWDAHGEEMAAAMSEDDLDDLDAVGIEQIEFPF